MNIALILPDWANAVFALGGAKRNLADVLALGAKKTHLKKAVELGVRIFELGELEAFLDDYGPVFVAPFQPTLF